MSQEVFQIMQNMDMEAVESQLALQCAPVLAGLKISNLLNIHKAKVCILKKLLKGTKLSYFVLLENANRVAILIYQSNALYQYLMLPEVSKFLKREGYNVNDVQEMFVLLSYRYKQYMYQKKDFPHEMGLFLGYPLEDVQGFIQNEGKSFLCSGYWKVYKDKETKMRLFRQYEQAKEWMILFVSNGVDLIEAMDLLRKGHLYSVYL